MTEEEKMISGQIYNSLDDGLRQKRERASALCRDYNSTADGKKREELLSNLLSYESKPVSLEGPIHFTYGSHTVFGAGCYANFNFTVLDHAPVTVGNNVMFGPNCTLLTALHPLLAEERIPHPGTDGQPCCTERAAPVTVGDRCWLAANVTVCPGVIVGAGAVIAAGSVVTSDIPENVLAAGVPCRVLRSLTEEDRIENTWI